MVAAVAVTGAWLAVAARKSLAARRRQVASGREALSGRTGVVRSWNGRRRSGVRGRRALARAPQRDSRTTMELDAGDAVVVERVSGLTLAVRRAEEWEEQLVIEVVLIVAGRGGAGRGGAGGARPCACCASTSAGWCSGSAA